MSSSTSWWPRRRRPARASGASLWLAAAALVLAASAAVSGSTPSPNGFAAAAPEYLSDVLRDWRAARKSGDTGVAVREALAERAFRVADVARGRERYEALRFVARLDGGSSSPQLIAARDSALARALAEFADDGDLLGDLVLRVLRDDAHDTALRERLRADTRSAAVRAACDFRPLEELHDRARAGGEVTAPERALLLEGLERIAAEHGASKHPLSSRSWGEFCGEALAIVRSLVLLGDPAPEIEGLDARGEAVALSRLRGTPVLLSFWGDWCAPCRALYPRWRALAGDPGLALFGVASDPDRAQAAAVLARERLAFPSVWDGPLGTAGPVASRWRVRGWPTCYLVDAQGIVRARWSGAPDEAALSAALAACRLTAR